MSLANSYLRANGAYTAPCAGLRRTVVNINPYPAKRKLHGTHLAPPWMVEPNVLS